MITAIRSPIEYQADLFVAISAISAPLPTSIHRNTVAWFAGASQALPTLCICTRVNAAAQLASVGVGIFPYRMIEIYDSGGAIVSNSLPMTGRGYLVHPVSADPNLVDVIVTVLTNTTRDLRYLRSRKLTLALARLLKNSFRRIGATHWLVSDQNARRLIR